MNIANFTSHISNMDRLIERAYSAYMDAPDSVMDIAKDKYYKTLTKCENERAECKDKIEALNVEVKIGEYEDVLQPTYLAKGCH